MTKFEFVPGSVLVLNVWPPDFASTGTDLLFQDARGTAPAPCVETMSATNSLSNSIKSSMGSPLASRRTPSRRHSHHAQPRALIISQFDRFLPDNSLLTFFIDSMFLNPLAEVNP